MPDAILDKVRKLLSKAEDPACTPAEAEAFTAKATELIAKYGVDSALLAAADPSTDPVGDAVIEVPAPYALDKCGLLAGVAAALRCQTVRRQGWSGERKTFAVHLFGHDADLRRVEVLFTSLLVQAAYALLATPVPSWENVAAFRRSWFAGYTRAIVARLHAAEERAAATAERAANLGRDSAGRSVALVLADRGTEVTQRVAEAYPRLRFAAPRRLAGGGRGQGYAAGQRADIGTARIRGGASTHAIDVR